MSREPNNHHSERSTTVAVTLNNEERKALIGLVAPGKLDEVVSRVSQIVERRSSPYPDPDFLRQVEELAPGSTAQIISASIKHLEKCSELDLRELEVKEKELNLIDSVTGRDFRSVAQGRWIGFSAYMALLVVSVVMFEIGAEKLSYAAFGTSVVGVIGQLIAGGARSVRMSRSKSTGSGDSTIRKA